jgi:hypothetical protein
MKTAWVDKVNVKLGKSIHCIAELTLEQEVNKENGEAV